MRCSQELEINVLPRYCGTMIRNHKIQIVAATLYFASIYSDQSAEAMHALIERGRRAWR